MSSEGQTERCRSCGAALSPGAEWCGQCFTPVPSVAEPEADATGSADHDTGPEAEEPYESPEPYEPAVLSRWHATPTTLGPMAKVAITVAYALIGAGLVPVVMGWTDLSGVAGLAFAFVYLTLWLGAGALFLAQVWRPGRLR